jgi:hypothetical protein
MNETQRILALGAIVNGALYLAGVFVAGLLTGHPLAWKAALAAAGASFVGYSLQIADAPRIACAIAVGLSIFLGVVAGVLVLP